jgi:hypothetical protein
MGANSGAEKFFQDRFELADAGLRLKQIELSIVLRPDISRRV